MIKIEPIRKKIEINNYDKLVENYWTQQENATLFSAASAFLLNEQLKETVKLITKKTLYIQTNKELDYGFIEVINNLWSRGVSIYILTNKLYKSYKDTIAGKVLVRYSDNISGDLILIDSNTSISKGFISDNTSFSRQKKFYALTNSQIEEGFHMFVYNFWKKADFECIDKESFDTSLTVQEAPFDLFPKLNSSNIICDQYMNNNVIDNIDNLINKAEKKITLIIDRIDIGNILFEKIASIENADVKFEIITNIDDSLQEVVKLFYPIENYEIYATEKDLFTMIIVDDEISILLTEMVRGENLLNSFCLIIKDRLSIDKLLTYRDGLIHGEDTFKYNDKSYLKQIVSNKIILDITKRAATANTIKENEEIYDKPETCESLLDLRNKVSRRKIDKNNNYSKIVNYHYDLLPIYRSNTAEKDKLYGIWGDAYDKISSYCKSLIDEVSVIESNNRGLFSNVISLFDKNKVNVRKTIMVLEDTRKQLSKKNYKVNELNGFNEVLLKAYEDYIKLLSNVEELKDYNLQLKDWNSKKNSVREKLDEIEKSINKISVEIKVVEDELIDDTVVNLENDIETKEEEYEKTRLEITESSENIKLYFERINLLNDIKGLVNSFKNKKKKKDIDKAIDGLKEKVNGIMVNESYYEDHYKKKIDNSKNPAMIITTINGAIITELSNFIEQSLSEVERYGLETLKLLEEDLEESKDKLKLENSKKDKNNVKTKLAGLNKTLNDLLNDKKRVESQYNQLGENFEYKPSKKNSKDIKIKKFDIIKIDSELPKVGQLYNSKEGRQLAIRYWEELEVGLQEAERLKAQLVCEKN